MKSCEDSRQPPSSGYHKNSCVKKRNSLVFNENTTNPEKACETVQSKDSQTTSAAHLQQKTSTACKSALFISLLTLILTAVIFYALSQNMQGLSNKISQGNEIKQQTAALSARIQQLAAKMQTMNAEIASQTRRNTAAQQLLREVLLDQAARQLQYVAGQLEEQGAGQELQQALALIRKAQGSARQNGAATAPEPAQK